MKFKAAEKDGDVYPVIDTEKDEVVGYVIGEETQTSIVDAVNNYEALIKIAQAYRNLLRTMAQTEGEVATFHHIQNILKGKIT